MANVAGPCGAAVGLAGEGRALARSLSCPRTAQTGGRLRAEVPSVCSYRLDDHEVLVQPRKGVHLDCFEQVVGRAAHDDRRCWAEAAWEISNGHAGPVYLAIVSCEEQIHVGAVTNERLVNGSSAGAGNGSGEKWLRR